MCYLPSSLSPSLYLSLTPSLPSSILPSLPSSLPLSLPSFLPPSLPPFFGLTLSSTQTQTHTHADSLQEPGSWTSGKTTPQELLDAMISPVRLQFNLEEEDAMSEGSGTVLGNPVPLTAHRDSIDSAFEFAGRKTSLDMSENSSVGQHGQPFAAGKEMTKDILPESPVYRGWPL